VRKIKSRSGFSLIETLLSALLFTFVVMTIGSSIIVSVRLNAKARRMTEARLAVSSAVETIMAKGVDKSLLPNSLAAGTPTAYPSPNGSVSVTLERDSSISTLYKITVTSTNENSVAAETYVQEYEPDPSLTIEDEGEGGGD
jgi:Tfp pilus assembly protein PilV